MNIFTSNKIFKAKLLFVGTNYNLLNITKYSLYKFNLKNANIKEKSYNSDIVKKLQKKFDNKRGMGKAGEQLYVNLILILIRKALNLKNIKNLLINTVHL